MKKIKLLILIFVIGCLNSAFAQDEHTACVTLSDGSKKCVTYKTWSVTNNRADGLPQVCFNVKINVLASDISSFKGINFNNVFCTYCASGRAHRNFYISFESNASLYKEYLLIDCLTTGCGASWDAEPVPK